MRVIKENIPNEWEIKNIGDYADVTKLAGFEFTNHIKYMEEGEIIALRALNAKNGRLDLSDVKRISKKVSNSLQRSKLFTNDIVFTYVGTIGEVAIIKENDKYHLAPNIAKITIKKGGNPDFLFQTLRSPLVENEIRKLLTNSSQPALSMGNIRKIETIFPSLSEQTKIAQILTTWDDAIEKTQQLIEQLVLRKKGLMQELLTGKKRLPGFTGEWKKKSLGHYITYTPRPVQKPKEKYLALGLRSHGKGVFQKPDTEPNSVAMDILYEVKVNDLVVNITFAWEQAIAIANNKDNGGLVSHRFPTFVFKDGISSAMYFRYFIVQPHFKYLLNLISPGGAGRNRVMSKKDFPRLEVKIPSYDEQQAIAEILVTADVEIQKTQNHLRSLKKQKKGLMQELLTGKKRVKI